MEKTYDEDDTMDLGDENDTVNLPDMEQDTMDLNVHEQSAHSASNHDQSNNDNGSNDNEQEVTVEEQDNVDEEDEMLDMNDLHGLMRDLMDHYDNETDMDNLREILDEAKHTRHCIQQAQREPKQTIRGSFSLFSFLLTCF